MVESGEKNHFLTDSKWEVGDKFHFWKSNSATDSDRYKLDVLFYVVFVQSFEIGFDSKTGKVYIKLGVSDGDDITWYWGGSGVENEYIKMFLRREGYKTLFDLCSVTYYGMFSGYLVHFRDKQNVILYKNRSKKNNVYGNRHRINKRKRPISLGRAKSKNKATHRG